MQGGPCYRCLYPEAPPPGVVPTCSEAGVLGAVTGVMGTLQATEVLKEILGIGDTMSGRLLVWDALATRFRTIKLRPDPSCALCGPEATIKDLSAHATPRRAPPVPSDPALGVLLLSGTHDRAHYAFVVASGAAALGRQVVLFATNRRLPRTVPRLVRPGRRRTATRASRRAAWLAWMRCGRLAWRWTCA